MSSKQKSAHVNIIYAAKAQAEKAKILNEGVKMGMFCYLLPSGLFGDSSPLNRVGTCVQFNCKARQTIKKVKVGGKVCFHATFILMARYVFMFFFS